MSAQAPAKRVPMRVNVDALTVAVRLGISPQAARRKIKAGELGDWETVGGRPMASLDGLAEYCRARRIEAQV